MDNTFTFSTDMPRPSLVTEQFLVEQLLDTTSAISERFRALFSLRNLRGQVPRDALICATKDSSNLLAHEAAFALGQMQDTEAVPALEHILEDTISFHPIVRHEAAEALGAIGQPNCVHVLRKSLEVDPAQEVKETCALALRRLEQGKSVGHILDSRFFTIDPAVPAPMSLTTEDLRKVLLDDNQDMYERYAALFALRNEGGHDAVEAIIAALGCQSALLKHEVAYVLGQLQDKAATKTLAAVLENFHEHPMVRHEAAEALGSIADSESVALLRKFEGDVEPIVAQSCEVALNMLEFEQNGKTFEYLYLETPNA